MGKILINSGGGGIQSDEVTALLSDIVKDKTALTSDSNDEVGTGTLELTGNSDTDDVLNGCTFYKNNPQNKLTGTLSLTGNAPVNYVYHGNNSIFNLEKRLGVFIAFKELYIYLEDNDYIKNKEIRKKFYENFNFYAIKGVFFMLLNPILVSTEEYNKYDKLFYEELRKIKFLPLKSKFLIYYYRSIVWGIRKFNLFNTIKKLKNRLRKD